MDKNSADKREERRRYPRIQKNIPLKIQKDNFDFVGQTQDISCIGAYCTVNKNIPLFSVISIVLLLPLKKNNKSNVCSVHCKGVIVRNELNPQNNKEYQIAIYFNDLRQSDKVKLSKYVQQHL